jgi:hypothetical protein
MGSLQLVALRSLMNDRTRKVDAVCMHACPSYMQRTAMNAFVDLCASRLVILHKSHGQLSPGPQSSSPWHQGTDEFDDLTHNNSSAVRCFIICCYCRCARCLVRRCMNSAVLAIPRRSVQPFSLTLRPLAYATIPWSIK